MERGKALLIRANLPIISACIEHRTINPEQVIYVRHVRSAPGIRAIATIILVALSRRREPETTLPGDTNPRNVVATAALATFTPGPSPTALPTLTIAPELTATLSVPDTIGVGVTVEVFNTDGLGLNMREGPGISFAIVELLPEETRLVIVGGPEEVDGLIVYVTSHTRRYRRYWSRITGTGAITGRSCQYVYPCTPCVADSDIGGGNCIG